MLFQDFNLGKNRRENPVPLFPALTFDPQALLLSFKAPVNCLVREKQKKDLSKAQRI